MWSTWRLCPILISLLGFPRLLGATCSRLLRSCGYLCLLSSLSGSRRCWFHTFWFFRLLGGSFGSWLVFALWWFLWLLLLVLLAEGPARGKILYVLRAGNDHLELQNYIWNVNPFEIICCVYSDTCLIKTFWTCKLNEWYINWMVTRCCRSHPKRN